MRKNGPDLFLTRTIPLEMCNIIFWLSFDDCHQSKPLSVLVIFVTVFDVHGSVHLGNIYVQLNVQLDVYVFVCIPHSSLFFSFTCFGCYLHPSSGAQTAAYSQRCV
jgi:hypothetical protein